MHLAPLRRNSDYTPEHMFAAKYAWLLRWALQFTENDRAAAEDLVQETFVRILLTWDKLHTVEELEPLLYTYLRYAYLSERRKRRSYAFHTLSTVDADTFAVSLRASASFNQIDVQSELRSILGFLLLRRRTAKFASMFLLRFFHGFYPEEIASIAVVTRHSVDLSLRQARAELKTYLMDSGKAEAPTRLAIPELQSPIVPIPREEFADELLRLIFESPRDECPSQQGMERHYRSFTPRSLDCGLLAHIVVCKPCLEMVTTLSDSRPPSARSTDDSLSYAPRGKASGKITAKDRASVARIIGLGKARVRDMFHHYPSGLVVSLNGEKVAERDISSPRAVLRVETHSTSVLGFVEVHSEQGVLMLALPIAENPPVSEPELSQEISLSGNRMVSLVVKFNCDGATVETTYIDPHFSASDGCEAVHSEIDFPPLGGELIEAAPVRNPSIRAAMPAEMRAWCRWLINASRRKSPRLLSFAFASVALLIALGALQWYRVNGLQDQARFQRTLDDSAKAEASLRQRYVVGAIHQRVQIKTLGKSLQNDIYRDVEGRRKPKSQQFDTDAASLRTALTEAKVDWDNPLSAAGFARWREHLNHPTDRVEEKSGGLLVLTTDAVEGAVRSESLTLTADTLHPIARTLLLENSQQIEIAELSYDIVPWGPVSSAWFDSLNEPTSAPRPRGDLHAPTAGFLAPTESELDLAMLGSLHALQLLHADTERLEVIRSQRAIKVQGVVESEERKRQIVDYLRTMPNVEAQIWSYHDLDLHPGLSADVSSLKSEFVVSGDSQLDRYCVEVHKSQDECRLLSYRLLTLSTAVVRESRRLADLQQQYPQDKQLSPKAQQLLLELARNHADYLNAALGEQQKTIELLGRFGNFKDVSKANDPITLTVAAKLNLDVVRELVYSSSGQPRATEAIFEDLATSVRQVRSALSRIPVMSADRSAASSESLTPHSD